MMLVIVLFFWDWLALNILGSDSTPDTYIVGDDVHDWPYHAAAIHNHLICHIATLYPEIRDKVVTAFDKLLDLTGDGEVFDSITIDMY